MSSDEWDDEDWIDEDWPDDDPGETLTVPCPACRADIYEDAERCPWCGEYVDRARGVWDGRPVWWVILGVLGIVATIFAVTTF